MFTSVIGLSLMLLCGYQLIGCETGLIDDCRIRESTFFS